MSHKFLIATLCSIAVCAISKAEPASAPFNIKLQVNYGERVTDFEIHKDGKAPQLSLRNNEGLQKNRSLSEEDYNFLKSEFAKLPKDSNESKFCPRSFIVMEISGEKKMGCLGGQNKMAEALLELVNLLSLQF